VRIRNIPLVLKALCAAIGAMAITGTRNLLREEGEADYRSRKPAHPRSGRRQFRCHSADPRRIRYSVPYLPLLTDEKMAYDSVMSRVLVVLTLVSVSLDSEGLEPHFGGGARGDTELI